MQYIAVRQRYSHDILRVDLRCADCLPRTSVFRLDSKLCDESIDAVRQEPGNHDKCVVLCKCRQVGHKARGCREFTCKWIHTDINILYNSVHAAYSHWFMHEYPRDSAVFMYKDLLKAPIPAGDMAAT